jgi:hypothetical protein
LARFTGTSIDGLCSLAIDYPDLFDQLYYELEIEASRTSDDPEKPSWRKPGESVGHARDRLRAEREAAKK